MKQIIMLLSIFLLVVSCDKEDKKKIVDYDFSTEFKNPEEIKVGESFTVTLIIQNKDNAVKDDLKMKISFSPNLNLLKGGTVLENNHIYDISFSEMENVKFTIKQNVIQDDTIRFSFSNSHYAKNAEYIITAKSYKGNIVINQTNGGKATETKEYYYNQDVELKATPNEGYVFSGWFDNTGKDQHGNPVSKLVSKSNPYKFKFVKSLELTPKFEIKKIQIVLKSSVGGTVSGGGNYDYGSNITLRAIPENGYDFEGWYENNVKLHNQPEFGIVTDKDRTLEAVFKPKKFVITLNHGSGGNVTGGGSFDYGTTITIIATPDQNHDFEGWFEGTTMVSSNRNYSFKVTGTRNLQGRFKPKKLIVTVNAGTGGSVQGGGEYTYGSTVTIKAHPSEHYTFEGWYENNTKVSSENNYTFVVTKAITLRANFKVKQYTVSLSNTVGGSVTGGGTFNYGTTITLKAVPATGYKFEGWFIGGQLLSTAVNFNYNVTGNVIIEGKFKILTYTIATSVFPAGSGTLTTNSPNNIYEHGNNVSLNTTIIDNNYIFNGWHEGNDLTQDNLITMNNHYEFVAVKDRVISARYKGKLFKLQYGDVPYNVQLSYANNSDIEYGKDIHVTLSGDNVMQRRFIWRVHVGGNIVSGTGHIASFRCSGNATVSFIEQ